MEVEQPKAGLERRRRFRYVAALALLTLLAAGLRFYRLGDYPGGYDQDEVICVYDAWSLLTTGQEHHGDRWPLNSRQFGDYPSSLPTYWTMLFVALMGPIPLATRVACACVNVAAVPFFGLLATRLFRSRAAGLFAAALLAVAPWALFLSRCSFSPGFITFFQVAALWLLHRLLTGQGARVRSYGMAVGVGVMLFLWTHEFLSQYLFAPFLIGAAMLIWWRRNARLIFTAGGVYSLLMLAAILVRFQIPAASGRVQSHSILFADHPVRIFLLNYLQYHSFQFLFDAPAMLPLQQIPGVAHISHLLAPLYALGWLVLAAAVIAPGGLRRRLGLPDAPAECDHWRRSALWIIVWMALAPVSGALFRQTLYTARVTHLLVGVLLVIAFGCTAVWHGLQRLPLRLAAPAFAVLFAAYLGVQTVKTAQALVRTNPFFKEYFQYGVPEVVQYLARQTDVRSVHFPPLHQGYAYYLLFTPVHPATLNHALVSPSLQNDSKTWRYLRVSSLDKYRFDERLDPGDVAVHAELRHQVRDRDRIWFDLYERDGNWFVMPHKAPATGLSP